ncbi:hypothetical protein [Micromonospora sp. NPDC050200]|uniref:hypothetical protein n=1 Tax=Micromonospora sp. NPDC050200 TaxID=3155664 RepID=UPI003405932D
MKQETHSRKRVPRQPETPARVRVRLVPFSLAMLALGRQRESQQAHLLEMDIKTLKRALAGESVGEKFMSQTISVFRQHSDELARRGLQVSLDEYFEVPTEGAA